MRILIRQAIRKSATPRELIHRLSVLEVYLQVHDEHFAAGKSGCIKIMRVMIKTAQSKD